MQQELEIKRLGYEGHGVGYSPSGEVYFVPGGVPGDRLLCEIPEGTKPYSEVAIDAIVQPSSKRVEPECPYFNQCGGCDWLNLNYEAQLEAKEQILQHVLSRSGLKLPKIAPIVGSDQPFEYRNRVQFRSEAGKIGFLRRKSQEIVDIANCRTAHSEINERLTELRNSNRLGSERTKIELVVGDQGEVEEVWNQAHGASGFTQIHGGQNEKLKGLVRDLVEAAKSQKVIELFSGSGNLTFTYAPLVKSVLALESEPQAVAKGNELATANGFENVRIFQRQVDAYWTRFLPPDELDETDTLILDPPRQGSFGALKAIGRLRNLRTIIYVSCSPLAFGQEAARYLKEFDVISIQPIDMFPQTRHIELVASLKYHGQC